MVFKTMSLHNEGIVKTTCILEKAILANQNKKLDFSHLLRPRIIVEITDYGRPEKKLPSLHRG